MLARVHPQRGGQVVFGQAPGGPHQQRPDHGQQHHLAWPHAESDGANQLGDQQNDGRKKIQLRVALRIVDKSLCKPTT